MSSKPPLTIVQISNPAAFSGQGSAIEIAFEDEAAAIRLAPKVAAATGRLVTVRDEDTAIIEYISAATPH